MGAFHWVGALAVLLLLVYLLYALLHPERLG